MYRGGFVGVLSKTGPLSHFNVGKLFMADDILILMPDILILRHPCVLHLTSSVPFGWLPLIRLISELIFAHGDLCFRNRGDLSMSRVAHRVE